MKSSSAPGRASGEAALFLRTALTGRLFQPPVLSDADPADRAYRAAYNEALAYLGARLVDPGSDVVARDERRVLAANAALGAGEARSRLDWLEAHRRFEASGAASPPASLLAPLRASRALRRTLARELGHRLGQGWFEAVREGRLATAALRRIFAAPLDPPRARRGVVRWLRRDEDVKIRFGTVKGPLGDVFAKNEAILLRLEITRSKEV